MQGLLKDHHSSRYSELTYELPSENPVEACRWSESCLRTLPCRPESGQYAPRPETLKPKP